MRPLANHVLLRQRPEKDRQIGKIIIPRGEGSKQFATGEVLAVGPGVFTGSGVQLPLDDIHVGDVVVYYRARALELTQKDDTLHVVTEPNIIAVYEESDLQTSYEKQFEAEASAEAEPAPKGNIIL